MTPCRITGAADVAAITAKPYDDFIAAHSVIDALERAAQRHAERNALAYIAAPDLALPAQVWTHARFIADVRRAANLFAQLADGAERARGHAAAADPAGPLHAVGRAKPPVVVCPINFLLNSGHIAELIDAAHANILVALGPNPELDIWSRVPALRAACPRLKHVLAVGGAPDATRLRCAAARHAGRPLHLCPPAAARRHRRAVPHRRHHRRAEAGAAHARQPAACQLERRTDGRDGRARRDPQRISAVPRGGLLRLRPVGAAVRRRGGAAHAAGPAQRGVHAAGVALRRARARQRAGHRADRDRRAQRRRCG